MSEKSVVGIAKLYSRLSYLYHLGILFIAFISLHSFTIYQQKKSFKGSCAFYSIVSISFDYSPHVLVALHHICSGNNNSRVFPGLTTTQVCINQPQVYVSAKREYNQYFDNILLLNNAYDYFLHLTGNQFKECFNVGSKQYTIQ